MKIFRLSNVALSSVFAMALIASTCQAETISSFTSTVGSGTAQSGRLSRNGVQQDWLGSEAFPGAINTGTTYYYKTYTYSSSQLTGAPYVDISVYDELNAGTFFVSAYANSYDGTNIAANWLGDEGASGNYFGTDARYFDVVLPVGDSLVLVVNNTAAGGAGTTAPFDVTVSAYADTAFGEPAPVPEPSTLVMLGTGLAGIAAAARRKIVLRA